MTATRHERVIGTPHTPRMPDRDPAATADPPERVAPAAPAWTARALSGLAVFDGCPEDRLAAIEPPPEILDVEPGEPIVRAGHLDHEWFVVLAGEASVSAHGVGLGVLGPGEHFGEIAILSGQPRRFTVRALTPMRVLVLSEQGFLSLLDDCMPFGRTLLTRLTQRLSSMAPADVSSGLETVPPAPRGT